ncbi:hypothetical protein M5X11_28115 [Paenibacillus alginolyticus]|uniref:DUF7678 domain-containing protein n=1 Tax=Paenibacillus alginolyticus TaxID=59839 RepID=UPI00041980C4|nr:hypothetical protein [Paenibacillus alginolyticus]MCY9668744.1 hypothetical protein [Paenibacillus alginolyticus]
MLFQDKGLWFMGRRFDGDIDGLFIQAQVFSEPSEYGIAKGRVSRLQVYPDRSAEFSRCLANYDRGWDGGPPSDRRTRAVIEKTIRHFDGKSIDWTFEEQR